MHAEGVAWAVEALKKLQPRRGGGGAAAGHEVGEELPPGAGSVLSRYGGLPEQCAEACNQENGCQGWA